MQEIERLAIEIADAARTSFRALFENGERYYYCTLYTTGEGHAPSISAWSWEALEVEAARQGVESDTPKIDDCGTYQMVLCGFALLLFRR